MKDKGVFYDDLLENLECPEIAYVKSLKSNNMAGYEEHDVFLMIGKPDFRRDVTNHKEKTFDFVSVDISLSTLVDMEDIKNEVVKRKAELIDKVLDKIEGSDICRKNNISRNYLKLCKITITRQRYLNFLFELKGSRDTVA